MEEVKSDGTIGKNIHVGKNIPIVNTRVAFIDTGREVNPPDLDELLAHNQPLNSLANGELIKKLDSQSLSPALAYAERKARDLISSTRFSLGLPSVKQENMKCVYFSDSEFENFSLLLNLFGAENVSGISNHELVVEIIRMADYPSYIIGSISAHELIHRFVDFRTKIYRTMPRPDYPDQELVLYDLSRAGLAVRDTKEKRVAGGILNELGNYFIQAEYIRGMLNDGNQLVKMETELREKMILEKYGEGAHFSFSVALPSGRTEQIVLARDKIHFDANGQLINSGMIIYMQLADDINFLCSENNEKPFMELLLQAKANPQLVDNLRKIMDEKIDKDFFRQLRGAQRDNMNDLLNLLLFVQRKIYGV